MLYCKFFGLIFFTTFILLICILKVNGIEPRVYEHCPKTCSCHISNFSQLPIATVIRLNSLKFHEVAKEDNQSYKDRNEVLDETDEKANQFQNDLVMKTAVCIVQEENEMKDTLQNLNNIEALTLLQSLTTENITLRGSDFKELKNLKILEIHGIVQSKSSQSNHKAGNLYLKYNALNQLNNIEYINLQNIQLLGNPHLGNKVPSPAATFDYANQKLESNDVLSVIQPNLEEKMLRKSKKLLKPLEKNLIFLSSNEIEEEIVPYEVYKENRERVGLYSFAGLKKLKYLRIYQCNLSEINWEMFDGLNSLETVSLEGNELLFVPDFAFYGAPGLRSLSLARNKLLNIQIMSLAGLFQLEHLDLSFNNISHLSELSLPPFPKLYLANFANNPMEIIFPSTFEIMNATKQLHLGSPDTTLDIHPNSFAGLSSLLKLNLVNIVVDILERELLRGMPQLRYLKISGKIRAISFDSFLDMPKLENLILSNCSIEKLSMDSFYGLYNLRSLDISNNLLSSLPPGLFDQQFSLKDLYLQNNNLTTLPGGFFGNVPAKMIHLNGNPWHCTCAMRDWKPSVMSQIKQKTKEYGSMCKFYLDKGSMCSLTDKVEYVYDGKVEPRCTSPKKFRGLGVFDVLRKELGCDKKNQKLMKINRKAYLAQKLLDYEKMKENEKNFVRSMKTFKNSYMHHQNDEVNKSFHKEKNDSFSEVSNHNNYTRGQGVLVNLVTETVRPSLSNEYNETSSKSISISSISLNKNINDQPLFSADAKFENNSDLQISFNSNSNNDSKNDRETASDLVKIHKSTKKEKEKLKILRGKEERLKIKEKLKSSLKEDSYKLKKIFQTKLENKRKEKLTLLNS